MKKLLKKLVCSLVIFAVSLSFSGLSANAAAYQNASVTHQISSKAIISMNALLKDSSNAKLIRTATKSKSRVKKTKTTYVYITESGTKYHRANCRYLWHSKIKISLKEAEAEGYSPCSVCDPPQ